ncbi:hypothetical protein V2J09_013376 [Rumex salicifolius]
MDQTGASFFPLQASTGSNCQAAAAATGERLYASPSLENGDSTARRWKSVDSWLRYSGFLGVPCSRSNGPQLCILVSRRQRLRPCMQAVQQGSKGPQRLIDIIRCVLDITRNYFFSHPKELFSGEFLC